MAGNHPRASKKINEHEDELGGFIRSLSNEASSKQSTFVASHYGESSIAQQLITTSTSSFWNVAATRSQKHRRSDYQPVYGSTPVSSVSSCLVASHSSPFSNSDDLSCQTEAEPEQKKTRARGFSYLPDMDVGFDSGSLSFTQCLQEGMSMNAADYTDLTRSVSANILQTYLSPYQGFRQEEKTLPLFHSFETREGPFSLPDFGQQEHPSTSERFRANAYERAFLHGEAGAGDLSREASTVPSTPNSSTSSSSSDGYDGQDQEPNRDGIVAGGSGDSQIVTKNPPEEVAADSCAETSKKPNRTQKKGQKRIREPRIALVTKSDVEHLEDGFRWRKYGQKAVKNSPYPRSYYRCTNNKCSVKKRVERSSEDPSMVITTYEGQHTHHSPGALRGSTESQFRNSPFTPFSQSALTFPALHLQMLLPPRSRFDLATQFQDQEITARSPQYRGKDFHPPRQPPTPQNDQGLLEDMLPPGVRKIA